MLSFPDPTDLIVTIQSNMTAQEGDSIELCVNLDTGVGMEISVEVLVAVLESGAGKRSNSSICVDRRRFFFSYCLKVGVHVVYLPSKIKIRMMHKVSAMGVVSYFHKTVIP